MLTSVVGTNWGDEGKGRMVDMLSDAYDVVVRYQGGNNAGHTVVNEYGKTVLNLLPSGIMRKNTANILGPGMVVDLEHLSKETDALRRRGVPIGPENLILSSRATICLPYHRLLDVLEEERLGSKSFGSTRRGISPVYADKYMKKTLRMGDLLYPTTLRKKVEDLLEWKNLTVEKGYGHDPIKTDEIMEWLIAYGKPFMSYVQDTGLYLQNAIDRGKSVLFEAQLGALRDIDFGIYPFTSASSTLSAYAPIAYSSCVGAGPFPCELFGEEGNALREAGAEYGAATGRPRRVGGFDVVASRYGTRMQGCTALALTKLDVLSYMEKIPVCVAYDVRGERVEDFPTVIDDLNAAKPIYEYLPGFHCDISACRRLEDLPQAARNYIAFVESAVGCPIRYVSVGAERDAIIVT